MLLAPGGMDLFYIDESNDGTNYVVTAVTVPFLRPAAGGIDIVWGDYLEAAKRWRKHLYINHNIPERKELHGAQLAKRRGNYKFGKRQFTEEEAFAAYGSALASLNFFPPASIFSVSGHRGRTL